MGLLSGGTFGKAPMVHATARDDHGSREPPLLLLEAVAYRRGSVASTPKITAAATTCMNPNVSTIAAGAPGIVNGV